MEVTPKAAAKVVQTADSRGKATAKVTKTVETSPERDVLRNMMAAAVASKQRYTTRTHAPLLHFIFS